MKNLYFVLGLSIVLLFMLSACGQMITVDKEIKRIKDNPPKNTIISEIKTAHLTKNEYPEIIVISDTKENSIVNVYEYEKKDRTWKNIYHNDKHQNYEGLERLSIVDISKNENQPTEHVFIGYTGGNSGVLNFYTLGENDKGKIDKLFDMMNNKYPNSHINITEKGFNVYKGEKVVEHYFRDGSSYVLKK